MRQAGGLCFCHPLNRTSATAPSSHQHHHHHPTSLHKPFLKLSRKTHEFRPTAWLQHVCCAGPAAVDSYKHEAHPPPHHHPHHHHQMHAEDVDLLQWMHNQGLPPCKIQLKEWITHNGKGKPIHYVAASQDVHAGELVLSVPWALVVTLERVLGNETIAELLTTNKLSELACLALYLMYEKKRGTESFWYPFIRELDRQRGRGQAAVESPLLWSSEELNDYFTGSPMKDIVLERLEGIKREYEELDTVWFMAGSLFKQYPFDIPTEAFSFKIFKQAFVAVQSCVVHLQGVSLARRFALIPLGPPLLGYKSNCKAMLKVMGDHVQLEVDRPYKAGEPIVVWCGPQPNSRLLLNYGFVDEDNPHDRLSVEAALNTKDPLYQAKRTIVQRHNKFTIQTFQFYKGKEQETLLDMLPYLRLAHLSDLEVLDSVFAAEGPVCPVSREVELGNDIDKLKRFSNVFLHLFSVFNQASSCNERAVLEQLSDYFTNRLAGYRTSLTEDESLLKDMHISPKKRVATQLMRIEKEILVRTLEEIQKFQDQLPNDTVSPCRGPYVPKLK